MTLSYVQTRYLPGDLRPTTLPLGHRLPTTQSEQLENAVQQHVLANITDFIL